MPVEAFQACARAREVEDVEEREVVTLHHLHRGGVVPQEPVVVLELFVLLVNLAHVVAWARGPQKVYGLGRHARRHRVELLQVPHLHLRVAEAALPAARLDETPLLDVVHQRVHDDEVCRAPPVERAVHFALARAVAPFDELHVYRRDCARAPLAVVRLDRAAVEAVDALLKRPLYVVPVCGILEATHICLLPVKHIHQP
mmetsp:Transcript_15940/g.52209  ORF Transcript_15940/g.52209 Transcript_15940/m.52209 type:complete len:200 (-) Transcript_15940:149-748(-)